MIDHLRSVIDRALRGLFFVQLISIVEGLWNSESLTCLGFCKTKMWTYILWQVIASMSYVRIMFRELYIVANFSHAKELKAIIYMCSK